MAKYRPAWKVNIFLQLNNKKVNIRLTSDFAKGSINMLNYLSQAKEMVIVKIIDFLGFYH